MKVSSLQETSNELLLQFSLKNQNDVKSHFFLQHSFFLRGHHVIVALGYGLDDRGSRVRFPVGAGHFSLHHSVQNGSGAHPASYPMGTRGFFPGGKATGA
jgi:hypothetical protein